MSVEVKLPDIGEGVAEGEMVQWLVSVGDSVEMDQPVAEIMTDKATVEVPSPQAGVVKELAVQEGDMLPIGETLLILEATGKTPVVQSASPSSSQKTVQPVTSPPAASSPSVLPPANADVLATPSTRRLAREMNVDLNNLQGTGLAGRVTRENVMAASQGQGALSVPSTSSVTDNQMSQALNHTQSALANFAGSSAVKPLPVSRWAFHEQEERVPLRGIRRKIAEQMQKTKHIVPHFTLADEARVTDLVELRAQAKEVGLEYGVKITYLPFVMKALVSTLREFPMLNASIDDEASEIVYKNYYNVGFAADTPDGLLVPVIKDVDKKTILEISKEITDLSQKARQGQLSLNEMKGATITVTNIGSVGGTFATPIINHPEVAIVGMYKITEKPVFIGPNEIQAEQFQNYTVTCDHRLVDGAVAARFLKSLLQKIESPSHLTLDMI